MSSRSLDVGITLAVRAERLVAWIRVVGGVIAVALTWTERGLHPPTMYLIEQSIYLTLIVVGIASLVLVRRLDASGIQRLLVLTFVADAVLMGAIEPSNAWVTDVLSSPVSILVPVIGGLKFGVLGAWIGTGAFAVSQVVYEILRTQVFGSPHSIENSVAVVVIGCIIGIMAGRLSTDARHGLERAEHRTADAEQARRQMASIHNVLLAGFGGDARAVARRMAASLSHVPVVQVLLREGDELQWAAGVPGTLVDLDVEALDRIGETGLPAVADSPASVASSSPRGLAIAPIRGRSRTIGALVLGGTLGGDADVEAALRGMQTLADQMGLAIEAARAFESESEVASRYQELDRLKTEFIAVASHELRTPLTAVNGFAATLERFVDDLDASVAHRLVTGIRRQGQRLERLVDDLTVIGDLGRDHVALDIREVDVASIIRSSVAVTADVDDVLVRCAPEARALADPHQLRVCLEHLIENAALYGEAPIEVRAERHGDRLRILVSDSGWGIPDERRPAIFEPFVLARDVNAHQRGSGLGLAIVKRLVLAMDGTIELLDLDRPGATFCLELPAASPATISTGTGPAAAERRG